MKIQLIQLIIFDQFINLSKITHYTLDTRTTTNSIKSQCEISESKNASKLRKNYKKLFKQNDYSKQKTLKFNNKMRYRLDIIEWTSLSDDIITIF